MAEQDPTQLARMLIDRHGLRAGAVAAEHAREAELAGEDSAITRWRAVQMAIMELKRTERGGAGDAAM